MGEKKKEEEEEEEEEEQEKADGKERREERGNSRSRPLRRFCPGAACHRFALLLLGRTVPNPQMRD